MLQDENIVLRPIAETDQAILAALANNKKVSSKLRDHFPFPYDVEEAKSFIDHIKKQQPVISFAIEYNGSFCGMIGLVPQTDIYRKSAEIGYWLGEPYWGKGIISRAIKLVVDYGFGNLDLIRIYAGIFEGNDASMRALEKNGFVREAIFAKAIFKDGKVLDEYRYGLTR